jgi:hypothetical protein
MENFNVETQNLKFQKHLAGGAALVGGAALMTAQPASATETDPIAELSTAATSLEALATGAALTIGLLVLGFGVGTRIIRKMSRG